MICAFPLYLKSQRSYFSIRDENKTFEELHVGFAHNTTRRDHHCFANTVIGWSFRVCLGAEEHKQWCHYRRIFLALRFARALVHRADPANLPVLQAK